ncbi:hypothetical protein HMPREF1144_4750 [Klebsiella sp. OBRC7]|nr:hypothetical protein HMPREF1144_4750 [Klebsiella sp. OBRC7]
MTFIHLSMHHLTKVTFLQDSNIVIFCLLPTKQNHLAVG